MSHKFKTKEAAERNVTFRKNRLITKLESKGCKIIKDNSYATLTEIHSDFTRLSCGLYIKKPSVSTVWIGVLDVVTDEPVIS